MTLVKDKKSENLAEFKLFDPYGDDTKGAKSKNKNSSSGAGSWMNFSNLDAVLEYTESKISKFSSSDDVLPFKIYHVTVGECKPIKAQKTGYFIFNPSLDKDYKSCKF
jgi:hypothetical protein